MLAVCDSLGSVGGGTGARLGGFEKAVGVRLGAVFVLRQQRKCCIFFELK